jgi:hypothetical protein
MVCNVFCSRLRRPLIGVQLQEKLGGMGHARPAARHWVNQALALAAALGYE